MERQNVNTLIDSLLAKGWTTGGEVARAAGITRQAAHHHLRRLRAEGVVELVGAGRGARYLRRALVARTFAVADTAEDEAWADLVAAAPETGRWSPNVRRILGYAFTEMANNAIDHSGAEVYRALLTREGEQWVFEVVDEGVGAFEHVRRAGGLPDHFEALQHLMKGRVTTAPDRHTGEGIFFTSKAVDVFTLEANGLRWTVDNDRADQAVGASARTRGTRVRCAIADGSARLLRDVFDAYSHPDTYGFNRSRVRLLDRGLTLVSRSEARRLAEGLDRFEEVVLDFAGVDDLGQAFADELFRVWASAHPGTRLVVVGMSPPVARMVARARAE
jgi:DNA-binding transcriptional ArsR family regulator